MSYFYLYKSTANSQWYFSIRAANHERIAQSEGYHNKQDALNTINLIRRTASTARVFDASVEQWAA